MKHSENAQKIKSAAIIGAGIGGLATAIRLAAKNYSVEVFEANAIAGGKIAEKRMNGYRFDLGPSVITLPHLVDELFELHGENPRDYFTYTSLKKPFQYFFEDGTRIDGKANQADFIDELVAKTSADKKRMQRYFADIKRKYDITKPVFIESSIHRLKDYLSRDVFKGIAQFYKIDAFKSMNKHNTQFIRDKKVISILNNYGTYVGSNPFVAPATLNVIPHIELSMGLSMPDGGIYSMVTALQKLAEKVGVKFYFNHEVEEIIVEKSKATGIKWGGKTKLFDVVVSNADVYFTYQKLLPGQPKPKHVLRQKKSSSVVAFYWGMNTEFPQFGLHNMLFSENQEAEFNAVFKEHRMADEPTLYLCITSKHVPADAPKGKENWFVLITAPNNQQQNWDELVTHARAKTIERLSKMVGFDIENHIECEEILSPPKIETRYRSAFGAVYGNSSNGLFAAFLRHANFSRKIKNLYFVGGSVHPGAGIPMCLNSAKIVEKMLQ